MVLTSNYMMLSKKRKFRLNSLKYSLLNCNYVKISVSYGYEDRRFKCRATASREWQKLTTGITNGKGIFPYDYSKLQHIRGENGP